MVDITPSTHLPPTLTGSTPQVPLSPNSTPSSVVRSRTEMASMFHCILLIHNAAHVPLQYDMLDYCILVPYVILEIPAL
jgi:hypothetical protein